MASTRKRGNGWEYVVDIGPDPATGERRQKTKSGFRTKKIAEQAAAELVAMLARGSYIEEKNITVKEFTADWLQEYEQLNDVKPSSVRQRQYQLRYLVDHLGALRLQNITRKAYQDFLLRLNKRLARNTLQNAHSAFKLLFARAVEMELIPSDPTQYAKIPRKKDSDEENELPRYLEKDELVRFLKTADSGPDITGLAFRVLAYTGMRIGELCALKWQDIDFADGTISIRRTLYNPSDLTASYELLTPKTKSSRRTFIVDPDILSRLTAHRTSQKQIRMKYRDRYHDEGFVFAREKKDYPGYPIVRHLLEFRIKKVLADAGLPAHFTPHSLRHTHTSLLAEAGVPIEEAAERLGHKNDRITRAIYLHVTKTVKRDSADKFAALMADVSKL